MERSQFTFYRSIYDSAQKMKDPLQRLGLYEAVMEFALFEKEPEGLSDWQDSVFISIRPNLAASIAKAKMGAKGKRGPAKKKNNEGEKENENEVEKEGEIEKENETELENERLLARGFTEFWNLYPVKVDEAGARKVWEDSVRDPEAVMDGLRKWLGCSQWSRDQGAFIPRAAKFLTQGVYRADPPGYVPMGGTGKLGQAELEAIARIMAEE